MQGEKKSRPDASHNCLRLFYVIKPKESGATAPLAFVEHGPPISCHLLLCTNTRVTNSLVDLS
jgi:hypothetical protein